MAQIPNARALTEGDGQNDYLNLNTVTKRLELPNGATLTQYADNYVTPGLQLTGSSVALQQSATAPVLVNGNTINTAGVGVARVAPGGAVTGIILQPGTYNGQLVTVVNESIAGNTVTFAAAGTSNVADGVSDVIAGLAARLFVWDAATSLWYRCN